ncbi:DNA/RNA polymerase superfamily protein [Gossypium australe]|uniref:DNA/RNA polymerase superfamily protein n=1 Tax=Gossypium australe TaxID=47621 RepID=A0A5B6UWB6_9ROSI|nr:DNA/RNA polymerase superfamily protein [Gossypium australe]
MMQKELNLCQRRWLELHFESEVFICFDGHECKFDVRIKADISIEDLRITENRFRVVSKRELLKEAHNSAYSIHLGSTKMYNKLKQHYWWPGMKREIT